MLALGENNLMPCILKQKTKHSPGVITFTHNEILRGVVFKHKRVRDYLKSTSEKSQWIYGVHIQGDCTYLKSWPIEPWQSFIMWSDPKAQFLNNISADKVLPLTCVNFMPEALSFEKVRDKAWDICIISRPSDIKRITETLYIARRLLDLKPDLKVVFIVADPRSQQLGNKTYKTLGIEKSFFELPRKLFSSNELKNFSFICSSQASFGNFPLSASFVADIIAKSKFLLLTSHSEGVPRVLAEALMLGTPCIVSKFLRSGINRHLTVENTLFIEDEVEPAARQIFEGLNNYESYVVDRVKMNSEFSESVHKPYFLDYLSGLIALTGNSIEGAWYLNDLGLRLACHGQKHNYQFMHSEKLFFDWMEKITNLDKNETDEDVLFGEMLMDTPSLTLKEFINYLKLNFLNPVKRYIKYIRNKIADN